MPTRSLIHRMLAGTVIAAVTALTASTAAAQAPTISPAQYDVLLFGGRLQSGNPTVTYASPGSYSLPHAAGSASANIQTTPFTALTVNATTTAPFSDCYCSGAAAYMNYFFRFDGLPGLVSASFMTDMFASVALPRQDEVTIAVAEFDIFSRGTGRFYDANGTPLDEGPSRRLRVTDARTSRFTGSVDFTVDANTEYRVQLFASVRTRESNTADAYIDPVITLAPGFANRYSLVLSPGVSNLPPTASTTVPEPGSLALLGAGLLGVAAAVRRRQQA